MPVSDATSPSTSQLSAGQLVASRYELLSRLGEGGMGVVYEAYDRLTGSRVALKRVPLETIWSSMMTAQGTQIGKATDSTTVRGMRAALASEFHTLASLRHPNIISVLDYGFDHQHTPFFTMELLPAPKTLVAAGAGLALEAQIDLIVQLLRALAYLHRHLIVHRDLKPSNVLVVERGSALEVKVLDFGIATTRGSAVELAGTLEYMAPEVLFGQAPTEAADLYSVGVMLYQMLSGRYPYVQLEPVTRSAKQQVNTSTNPTLPAQLADFLSNRQLEVVTAERRAALEAATDPKSKKSSAGAPGAELPGPLGAVVQRLLARDPVERYREIGQVLADLGAALGKPLQLDTAETRESFLSASVMVGRERELKQLTDALERARRGAGGAILLSGESGVGKSRLLDEVRSSALVRGVRVLRGQCVSTAGGSYDVFLDVLRALVLDTPLEDLEASVLKELIPDLPTLLGTPVADAPTLGAQATRQRLRRVILNVLTRPTEPILLLLEDIQWAAPDSLDLLRELLPRLAKQPLLLVASAREDEQPDIAAALPGATLLRLLRLTQEAIATLSESMLGKAGTHPDLLALLTRETEGNAFFIVEVVRALAEEVGSLDLVGKRTLPRHVFAGGVQMVVARRLGRVPEWARPLLKVAAVAGRRLDRRLLGVFESGLERWLQVCADAAILEAAEAEWRFSHDKLRERLLELLEDGERRELHRRVGEAMEAVYGQEGAHVGALGYHFEEAGQLNKAARYLAEAGARALRRGAVQESLALLERTVALQAQTGVPALEQAKTLRRMSKALYGLGRTADCLEVAQRAMTLLGRPIPQQAGGRLLAILRESADEVAYRIAGKRLFMRPMAQKAAQELLTLTRGTSDAYFVVKGRLDEALYVMLCALHAAESIDVPSEQVNYLMYLGLLAYSMPLHALGRYYMSLAQKLLPRIPDENARGGYFGIATYMHSAQGEWQASLDAIGRWLEIVRRIGDEGQEALVYRTRGCIYLALGQYDKMWEDGEAGLRIGRRLENKLVTSMGILTRGIVLFRRGETAASWEMLTEGLQLIEQSSNSLHKIIWNGAMAEVACRAGHLEQAREQLQLALRRMQRAQPPTVQYLEGYGGVVEAALHLWQLAQSGAERAAMESQVRQALWQMGRFAFIFPVGKARALIGLGRYLWLRGQSDLALRCLRAGLQDATRVGLPYDQALAHLWLGRFGQSAGGEGNLRGEEARRHLEEAAQKFAALGMPREREQAERLLS